MPSRSGSGCCRTGRTPPIRGRTDQLAVQQFTRWPADTVATGIAELTAFVAKLDQERSAVEAPVFLSYSQGQAEGQINRFKTITRAMYGRANFDLLRERLLVAS